MQTDRNAYISGDTIWAKAFFTNTPINGDKHPQANIWITDCTNKVISRTYKFKIQNRYSIISVPIPEVSYTGTFYIHVSLSGSNNNSFRKAFKIYGNNTPMADCIASEWPIFPEGGKLIDGVDTRLVIKNNGYDRLSAGEVFNTYNEPVAKFSFDAGGIAECMLKAQLGNSYYIKLRGDSSGAKYPLPTVQDHGLFIKVKSGKNVTSYEIAGKPRSNSINGFLVAHQSDGKIVYQKHITNDNLSSITTIPTETLPSGVLRLALFDVDTTLLAERLCFINNKEYLLKSSFISSLNNLSQYGENLYALSFDQAIAGAYAVSVTDAYFDDPSIRSDNIYSAFLMSNNLSSPVCYPPVFFESPTDSTNSLIDRGMIADKWQGKKWEDEKKYHTGESIRSEVLSGIITAKNSDQPLANQKINVVSIAEDSTSQSIVFQTDREGRFRLDDVDWIGKNKLLFNSAETNGKLEISVALDSFPQQKQLMQSGEIQIKTIAENKKNVPFDSILAAAKVLENVTVKSKRPLFEKILINRYATGVFKDRLGEIYDFTEYAANMQPLLSYLFPLYRSLKLKINSNGQRSVEARNIKGEYEPAQVYVDEVPVLGDIEQIDYLNVTDIAVIKVISDYNISTGTRSPSVLIYTRKGADYLGADANYDVKYFEGFSKVYSFNNPKSTTAISQPDNRNITIYWNNKAATSNRVQVIPIHFFNNAFASKFKIVVEGVREDNKLFHFEKIID